MAKIISPKCRGAYVTLITPKKISDEGEAKYSMSLLVPKNSKKGKKFIADLEEMFTELLTEKLGKPMALEKCKHYPIIDGDEYAEEKEGGEEFEGHWIVRSTSSRQPGILIQNEDGEKGPLESPTDVYSGAWFHASLNPYAWSNKFGKGVSIGLNGVLKVQDDEPFAASGFAASDFDDL